MTDLYNQFEMVGLHRTGASQKAVRLSEESRLDITPFVSGNCHVAFITYSKKNQNDRMRGFTVPNGSLIFQPGYFNTLVARRGNTITIWVENYGEKIISNITEDFPFIVASFDPTKEIIAPRYAYLTEDNDYVNFLSSGTFVNNLFEEYVEIQFIAFVPHAGSFYRLFRDNRTRSYGMTYSDARAFMINERKRILGETTAQAFFEIMRQTHQQIPSRVERDNAGFAIVSEKETNIDGSGPTTPSDYLYRLVKTERNCINTANSAEFKLANPEAYGPVIKRFDDLTDVWGIPLGPMEATNATLDYALLKSDGKLLASEQFESEMTRKIRAKLKEINDAGFGEHWVMLMQKIENAEGDSFSERFVNMITRDAEKQGDDAVNFFTATMDFFSLIPIQDATIEFATTFALGEVLSYGRRGIARKLINAINGTHNIKAEYGVKRKYNEFASGELASLPVDATTGYYLFGTETAKEIVPLGIEIIPDTTVLSLSDNYIKEYGYIKNYKSKDCVITLKWSIDLSKVLFTEVLYDDKTSIEDLTYSNFLRYVAYIDNIIEMVMTQLNWYIMHIVTAGWDNIAIPLNTVTSVTRTNYQLLLQEDYQEIICRFPHTDKEDKPYYEVRFPSNGERITIGVPTVEEIFKDPFSLVPNYGYKMTKIDNTAKPFIIVEEKNFISTLAPNHNLANVPPIDVIRGAIRSGEMEIVSNESTFDIKEPSWTQLTINENDRFNGYKAYGNTIPSRIDLSGLANIVDKLNKTVQFNTTRNMQVPPTFTGTVVKVLESGFLVNPDGQPATLIVGKLSDGIINKDDRVLCVEVERGRHGALKLPIASTAQIA